MRFWGWADVFLLRGLWGFWSFWAPPKDPFWGPLAAGPGCLHGRWLQLGDVLQCSLQPLLLLGATFAFSLMPSVLNPAGSLLPLPGGEARRHHRMSHIGDTCPHLAFWGWSMEEAKPHQLPAGPCLPLLLTLPFQWEVPKKHSLAWKCPQAPRPHPVPQGGEQGVTPRLTLPQSAQ